MIGENEADSAVEDYYDGADTDIEDR